MNTNQNQTIGQRIKTLRKQRGLNQTELAKLLDKSLRTVQKYESGEIEVSIAMVHALAKALDTSSTYLLGHKTGNMKFQCAADIFECLFELEKVTDMKFSIDVKKPPKHDGWSCSITFDGKDKDHDRNTDMCLFLESWLDERKELDSFSISPSEYYEWQNKQLAYYAASNVTTEEMQDLTEEERRKRRHDFLMNYDPRQD